MARLDVQGFLGGQDQNSQSTTQERDELYTRNYGGINLEASPINMSINDSPSIMNLDISLSGQLVRRGGSMRLTTSASAYPDGYLIAPFELPTGQILVYIKDDTTLFSYLLSEKETFGEATLVETWANFFSSSANRHRPTYVITSEEKPRIIFATPNNCIMEVEMAMLVAQGDGDTTIAITGDLTADFLTGNTRAIYNNTVVTCNTIAHSAGVTTFTFAASIPTDTTVTIISSVAHWWAEAIKVNKEQIYASVLRFNTSIQADASVLIPTEIQRGILTDYESFTAPAAGRLPIRVYGANFTTPAEDTFNRSTSSATAYAFSDLQYTDGTSENITFGTTYLTYGAITGAGTDPPTPKHLVRIPYLPFNGNSGILNSNLSVRDKDGTAWTLHSSTTLTTTARRYLVTPKDWSTNYTSGTVGTNLLYGVFFAISSPFGLESDYAQIINTDESTVYHGTACTTTYYSATSDYSYRPVFGMSEYVNVNTGSYPTIVALYQNRLVFSGFPSAPNVVLCSNQGNERTLHNYQNYQIYREDPEIARNPIEIVMDLSSNEYIIGMTNWFDSLFVFTNRSVKRVFGSSGVALSPTNFTQSDIATIGGVSRHSITKTDRNVYFVSDAGVFRIAILPDSGDYFVENIAVKIRSVFQNSQYLQSSWLVYNPRDSYLYCGMSDGADRYLSNRLFVFNIEREAWTEYGFTSGYFTSSFGNCIDDRFIVITYERNQEPDEDEGTCTTQLLEMNRHELPIDFTVAATTSPREIFGHLANVVSGTTNANNRIINLGMRSAGRKGFRPPPLQNSGCLRVTVDGDEYVEGTDYLYNPSNNSIHILRSTWTGGLTYEIDVLDNESSDYPIYAYDANFVEISGTRTINGNERYNISTGLGVGDYRYGLSFPIWHVSPTFYSDDPHSLKRTIHYIGYYDNSRWQDRINAGTTTYDNYKIETDVNVAITYNNTFEGTVIDVDVYGSSDFDWQYPTDPRRPIQYNNDVRIVVPILGVCYAFNVVNYLYTDKAFSLTGFKVDVQNRGKHSRSWY